MKKSQILVAPPYYQAYLALIDDRKLMDYLSDGSTTWFRKNLEKLKKLDNKVYAEGKWTVKQIAHHVCDTERIMTTRCLRIVRGDVEPQRGFNENVYAANSKSNSRTWESLLDEYNAVRQSSIHFFKSLSDDDMMKTCEVYKFNNSVIAMGFLIVAHPVHHCKVIAERYFPLI